MDYRIIIISVFAAFALLELALGRLLFREQTTKKDLILEIGAGLMLPGVVVPMIMTVSAMVVEWLVPGSEGALAHWSFGAMFLTLLIVDDLTQYFWHRLSHSSTILYGLHRAHHSAEYLSVRVTYRNNILYYAMMPGLWFSGVLLYLGFLPVYVVYYVAKMTVITAAHSSVAWDDKLLQIPWLRPVMWVVQRTISTPSTHSAHHGRHADDGITHYKGNFGNFLFFWDVLFGTAKISATRPPAFGLENVEPATWFEELLWPFGPRRQPASPELGASSSTSPALVASEGRAQP